MGLGVPEISAKAGLRICSSSRRPNQEGEIIFTYDLDYGPLLLFSQRRYPSVILFCLRLMRVDEMASLLIQRLDRLEEPLREGA